ncbi:MAG: LysR family transcriptional regulator [Pseudomonadota bacterium]
MKPAYLHRLTLRQIEVFLAICRHRSYSRAAGDLGLTQPAVSAQMRALEAVARQPLFDYVGKQLYLTPAGEQLERTARDVQQRLVALEMELAGLQGQLRGTLQLAIESGAQYRVPAVIAAFCRLHPQVNISLTVARHGHLLRRLDENFDDLVLMTQVPDDMGLAFTPVAEHRLVAVAWAGHPMQRRTAIHLSEFLKENVLLRESESGTRKALAQFCVRERCILQSEHMFGSNEVIRRAVQARMGVAVLPEDLVADDVRRQLLCTLDVIGMPLRHSWCVTWPKGKQLTPAASAFQQFLVQGAFSSATAES